MDSLELSFPFVEDLPKREKSRWQKFRDAWATAKAKGPLIPLTLAAKLSDVSRQRLDELIAAGKLERVDLEGHVMITEDSLIAWLDAPDEKPGPKGPRVSKKGPNAPRTAKQLWKVSREWAEEQVHRPRKKS